MKLVRETVGGGDTRWLGSAHGIRDARSENLDLTGITGDYVPSGTRVSPKADGGVKKYDGAVLAGFVLFDQSTKDAGGSINVPILDHGRIRTANLPETWDVPTTDKTQCVYI